jgi:hypothetical protein
MIMIHADGSITYTSEDRLPVLKNYRPDLSNTLRLIPNFEPCKYRKFIYRSPCGRIQAVWQCEHFNKLVSITDCESCHERKESGTIALGIRNSDDNSNGVS